jgi:phenylalanyl-tRNA synthetase beta chain
VTFGAIRARIEALAIPELTEIRLREVFTGKQIAEGKRALTLNLCYRAADRTLTDEEVAARHARVLETLATELGAVIR